MFYTLHGNINGYVPFLINNSSLNAEQRPGGKRVRTPVLLYFHFRTNTFTKELSDSINSF